MILSQADSCRAMILSQADSCRAMILSQGDSCRAMILSQGDSCRTTILYQLWVTTNHQTKDYCPLLVFLRTQVLVTLHIKAIVRKHNNGFYRNRFCRTLLNYREREDRCMVTTASSEQHVGCDWQDNRWKQVQRVGGEGHELSDFTQ